MSRIFAALLAACFCFLTIPAVAATTGLVRGTILVNNKAVAGVHVMLEGEGSLLQATTDSAGHYVLPQVPFGDYMLSASYPGVAEKKLQVTVASDQVLTINFALGELATIASANVTARAGVGGTPVSVNNVTRAQIAALPVNNSLNSLVETVPGVVKFSYNEPVAHGFHGISYEIDGAPLPLATSSNFAEIIDPKTSIRSRFSPERCRRNTAAAARARSSTSSRIDPAISAFRTREILRSAAVTTGRH